MNVIAQQPRYMQLAQALLNDVHDGRYKVGDLLPTEHELCTQFGVSRFTVRQALRQMIQRGMVVRQPGVGTRLVSTETNPDYRQGLERVSDILHYAADTELHILRTRELVIEAGELADFLEASPGQVWLQIDTIRRTTRRGEKPICYTEVFLPPAFRSLRGLKGRAPDAIYRMIEQQFGDRTVEVRQELSAGSLPRAIAEEISATPRSPCLWITRVYLNARRQVVEATRSAHPADRFRYQQVFRQTQ
jgi:DNA-binding GntR family transcriptional regulator